MTTTSSNPNYKIATDLGYSGRAMLQALYFALTEENYHSEAEIVAKGCKTLYSGGILTATPATRAYGEQIASECRDAAEIARRFLAAFEACEYRSEADIVRVTMTSL